MKDKIVIWCGLDFTQYCTAYYLQKMIDCELYSIVDVNVKTEKFFKSQKLVNFKQFWFLHHQYNSDKKLPDLEYLKYFEKKYDIDLWKLAINERSFYGFFNYHKFSSNEILSIVEQICKFFESFFEQVKPNFFITKLSAFFHLELFRQMCIFHGVKVLMLSNPKIPNKNMISEDDTKFDYFENLNQINYTPKTFSELNEEFKILTNNKSSLQHGLDYWKTHSSNSFIKFAKISLMYIFSKNSNYLSHFNYYGRTKLKVIINSLNLFLRVKIREIYMNKNLTKTPNLDSPFVYFPLGIVLERHILIGAPFHTNQIELIRNIVKSLPVGYRLLVKEHPVQKSREWRPISEYKQILEIPNVTLIHYSVSDKNLIQKSSLVFSVSGSTGFEAILKQKPVIVFGDAIYSYLSSVKKNTSIENLSKDIRNSLDTKVDSINLSQYFSLLSQNLISFNFADFSREFYDRFAFNGGYNDVDIDETQLESFILEKKESLEYLSKCHLDKIQQHKNAQNIQK